MALITDYIRTLIPTHWKSSPSGWTSGNCPMCVTNGQTRPDTKGRGGFHFEEEKFQYNCFNCGYKTGWAPGKGMNNRLKRLMMAFGADESDVQRLQLELMQEDQLNDILKRQTKRQEKVSIDWPEIALPANSKPFKNWDDNAPDELFQALSYLMDRNLLGDLTDNFLYSDTRKPGMMNKRFIIPYLYQGKVVGYTARWTGTPPEGVPKYFKQAPPKNFVYGLDKQTSDKRIVIVTEGELDAIVTDGVAIGSNNCNDDQANIIDSLQKRVILLPDADKSSMRLVNTAIERGWEVSFPEWNDCKDAGDALIKYGRLATVRSILDSTVNNEMKIKVLAKGYCK